MGPKVAIIHADKVTDPRVLASVLEQLGVDEVRVSLRRLAGDPQIAAIVAAIPAGHEATFRFVSGSLAGVDLAALVATSPGSLSLHAPDTSLHVWPTRATVIRREAPDLAAVAALLGEDELRPGATTIGVTTVTIDPAADGSIGHVNAFDLGTSDLGIALDVFAAIATRELDRGWLTRPSQATLDALPAFIAALGGELELDVVLASHDATDLAVAIDAGEMCLDSPIVSVRLPDGELSTRVAADDETAWRLRIGDAVSVSKFQPTASAGEIE